VAVSEWTVNSLHWLDRLLPQLPHYGFALVFLVVFLSNIGFPFPGKVILFGAGFVWGRAAGSLWEPMLAGTVASFLGGTCAFWLGRRVGHGRLTKIHWLHLTTKRLEWPERYFKRHGEKTVFLARFIPVLPSAVANLLEGTTTIPWRTYLWLNLAGSAAYTTVYILLGYFLGRQLKFFQAWLGPTAIYAIMVAIALIVLGFACRHLLSRFFARAFFKTER
jgi:membrane protein DedA with SNARE-associated domain